MRAVERTLTGTAGQESGEYEKRHREIAREAAAEGFVLLRNREGILPLSLKKPIALYGAGAEKTIKGGTGSGDVNSSPTVSIREGLLNAGFRITTSDWLDRYQKKYDDARIAWRDGIFEKAQKDGGGDYAVAMTYFATPFHVPEGDLPDTAVDEKKEADVALYVLARTAGEGADRFNKEGDYQLTETEENSLKQLSKHYQHVVLILNTGGLVDLHIADEIENLNAILYIHQPGMEAGNAVADVLTGKVNPSGKLTDSWAMNYEDYPNAENYSHNNNDVDHEIYAEDLYVGYRYFDTYGVPVRYGFGFGLSYTAFEVRTLGLKHYHLGTEDPEIGVTVRVRNTGGVSGREVAQVYASCPQGEEGGELRRLVGYAKTRLLAPGDEQEIEIRFPLYALASFSEEKSSYVLKAGEYVLQVGNALERAETAGEIRVTDELCFYEVEHICQPQQEIPRFVPEGEVKKRLEERRDVWIREAMECGREIILHDGDIKARKVAYETDDPGFSEEARAFVDKLSQEQLIKLATGFVPEKREASCLGDTGNIVPGAAAQTSSCAKEEGLSEIALADGPAGLRLCRKYGAQNGVAVSMPPLGGLEDGFLAKEEPQYTGEIYYQYATAFPCGTLLAQTWDPEVLKKVGKAVGHEAVHFGVTLWLAPGMNIHRNPLCGRNFEYYSEDPLISGTMAAAITQGVQSVAGVGTTIKHFACNNQEDNRMASDSILSERALREIYLKGFEIAVRTSSPFAIMTSYNKINGIHAANCYDTCTKVARKEWGFCGLIMTDWTTTHNGPDCTASGCMRAGNDLVMPGCENDHQNMREELASGSLKIEDLKRSVARLVDCVMQSNFCEKD